MAIPFAAVALSAAGCTFEPPGSVLDNQIVPQPDSGAVSAADASVGGAGGEAEAFFVANVVPLMSVTRLKGACIVCHQGADLGNGPDFLGIDDASSYAALFAVPGLIAASPATSRFPNRGDHAGDAFTPTELDLVNQWIVLENTP